MRAGEAWQARTDAIGLVADWRKPGFVWEMPFGALLPRDVRGVLMAGRCIASVDDAWEVTRVIPAAAVSGQAAGAAAALAARQGITPDALDVTQLQQHLRARGVPLQYADVGLRARAG
ncbi:MAG: FAD-dependent oxidoreductase [bacterium]|nr:FAD-dependent oxidoreductase [bacterium]